MSRIGELLLREKLISLADLQRVQAEQKKSGERFGAALVRLGLMSESDLTQFISKQYRTRVVDLDGLTITPEILKLLKGDICRKHWVIPVQRSGSALLLAMADPSDMHVADDIKFLTGLGVEVVVASDAQIDRAIKKYYENKSGTGFIAASPSNDVSDLVFDSDGAQDTLGPLDLKEGSEDAPVVKLVNLMLMDAIKKGASDIHVEPYEKLFRVRYRIDGSLYEVMKPPLALKNAVTSRIKIMSNLDIAERRLPQDGRIKLRAATGEMDFRVSVCPTLFGEKVVLRLLDKSNLQLDMTKLGFQEAQLADFKDAIHKPFGMVLVTGPTGSGKTTTLYSALSELNKTTENISTAEDPVEFNLPGINQVQMHEDIGLNFAAALRAFLRQDPDIIMVGEIRDFETAEIAIKAALTGHMMLSTLHTNDAPSTVSRLINMGIEPFLITASLNCVVAQRLARRVCIECKEIVPMDAQVLRDLQVPEEKIGTFELYRGRGCKNCAETGYKGRVAVYEVMVATDSIKTAIQRGASTAELKIEAIRSGMQSLRRSAVLKLMEGITTISEVSKVSMSD